MEYQSTSGLPTVAGHQSTDIMNISIGLRASKYLDCESLTSKKVVLFYCRLFNQDGLVALTVFPSFALPL